MRAISAAEDATLIATGGRGAQFRAKVRDSGGTFRDLSSYPGQNFCLEASWKEDVDSPGMDADIVLKREVCDLSLAPLKTASPLNRAFATPGSYAPLIALAREVQIEVAVNPDGIAPVSGDWVLAFHGYIDDVDAGSGEHITLRCSDLQAKLRDTWIERERTYAFAQGANATAGCIIWRASDTLAVGARGLPSAGKRNAHFYRVTAITTGITAATEPTWPTGAGATVVDGGVTWTESGATSDTTGTAIETIIQQILDDNVGGITLSTPASPGFTLLPWKQDRMSVWDAIRKLVDLMGWDLRYKWDSGSSTFKLTLYTPDRAKTVPDRTFSAAQRYPLTRLPTQIQWVRNAVFVVYSDVTDRFPNGTPKRKTVVRTDATSITAYGRRFCEMAEASTSGIDTAAEANTLADNVLSDLANPVAEHECEMPLFRHVELGDLYRWSADGIHYDADQDLAVTQYKHSINGTKARTTIQTRGKPSAGMRRWHAGFGADMHRIDLDQGSGATMATLDVVGGTKLSIAENLAKHAITPSYEFHVSATSSFTPSSATLVASGNGTDAVVADLIAGKTYYTRYVPFGRNASKIVRGQASTEQSFVAGRASAGHMNEGIALGDYPLNGGFETRLDTAGMPDHWKISAGAFGSDVTVREDGSGISGGRYVRIEPAADASITSAKIPIINEGAEANRYSGLYRFSVWVKNATGNNAANNLEVYLRGFDYAGGTLTALTSLLVNAASKTNHWQRVEIVVPVDASVDIRSIDAVIHAPLTSGQFRVDIDEVRCQYLGTPWYAVGDTTKFTDTYDAIPGFANSWVNFGGAGNLSAGFRRNREGRVFLQGIIKSGTVTAAAFVLPAAYRPVGRQRFPVYSNNASGQVDIDTSGNVIPQIGSNVWFDLTPISFETF